MASLLYLQHPGWPFCSSPFFSWFKLIALILFLCPKDFHIFFIENHHIQYKSFSFSVKLVHTYHSFLTTTRKWYIFIPKYENEKIWKTWVFLPISINRMFNDLYLTSFSFFFQNFAVPGTLWKNLKKLFIWTWDVYIYLVKWYSQICLSISLIYCNAKIV